MAGADGFDAATTRARLRAVMFMGLPEVPADRPIFHFPSTPVYAKHDEAGKTWDYTQAAEAPLTPPRADLLCGDVDDPDVIVCTYQVLGRNTRNAQQAPMAKLDPEKLEFTFLDVDYEKVKGFTSVTIGLSTYKYSETLPVDSLHDLSVITVIVDTVDAV